MILVITCIKITLSVNGVFANRVVNIKQGPTLIYIKNNLTKNWKEVSNMDVLELMY